MLSTNKNVIYADLDFNEPFKGRAPFELHSSVHKVEKVREVHEIEDQTHDFRQRFKNIRQTIATQEQLSKDQGQSDDRLSDFKLLEERSQAIQNMHNYHCNVIKI
jgi:hypothetical protein